MTKPQIIEHEDGFDIVLDSNVTAWHSEVVAVGKDMTHIKFRKANGKNPLRIKDITGVDIGQLDAPLGINYEEIKAKTS